MSQEVNEKLQLPVDRKWLSALTNDFLAVYEVVGGIPSAVCFPITQCVLGDDQFLDVR